MAFFGIFDETAIKLIGSVGILFLGFIVSSIGSKILNRLYRKHHRSSLKRSPYATFFRNTTMTITVFIALFFLRIKITEDFFLNIYELVPDILSFLLLVTLVIIIVNSLMSVFEKILEKSGISSLVKEYDHGFLFNVMLGTLRITLYLMLGILALNSLGIASQISRTLSFVLYPLFIFFLALIFYGTKDFISNFFAGMFIRSSENFQIGQRIRYKETSGIIEKLNNESVLLTTDDGCSVSIPNNEFLNTEIHFKELKTDIPTLETIKKNYVAQTPSYCGPASASMILNIFGHDISQEKIGDAAGAEVGKGAHPLKLIEAVSKLTDEDVIGTWIDIDKINDLREETISWLNDGALVIIDYKKNVLFPESKGAHYSIVLAVEGDEFVVLDPSSKKGGVFLADYKKIEKGMDTFSDLIQGKRGYLVFAQKDSRAYYRIEKGLIYSDINLYKRLNRTLQKEFKKVAEKTDFLEDLLPGKVRKFIESQQNKERISRVWRPRPRNQK